jgi:hypothetical protein
LYRTGKQLGSKAMEEGTVDIFAFTTLRAPIEHSTTSERRTLIQDDFMYNPKHPGGPDDDHSPRLRGALQAALPGTNLTELFSQSSVSVVARLLMAAIRVELSSVSNASSNTRRRNARIVEQLTPLLLATLSQGLSYGTGSQPFRTAPVISVLNANSAMSVADSAILTRSMGGSTIAVGSRLYRCPAELNDLPLPMARLLDRLYEALKRVGADATLRQKLPEQRSAILAAARKALSLAPSDRLIDHVVSADGAGYVGAFIFSKRVAFDCYYAFYLLRRSLPVDLTSALVALRTLNALEQLAIDEFLTEIASATLTSAQRERLELLKTSLPQLADWNPAAAGGALQLTSLGVPGIRSFADLTAVFRASPVVHPVFARLAGLFVPFNEVRPIGFGEMKVVRQKFKGYEKGGIAHIETVLAGEDKTRTHRRLDKSESTFSFSSATDSSFSKDSQTTSRFEIKNESDRAVQLTLGVNAGTTLNFKGGPVLDSASVTAGVSLNVSDNKTERLSQSFAREVVQRATESVQTKVASQRSQTLSSESEETNIHKVVNPAVNGNISGIYLWLDKVYEGQVFDLGQRLMFEFVVPEPAAFYVDSRLQAYARSTQLPRKPTQPTATPGTGPILPVRSPAEITQDKFRDLSGKYEISRFKFPEETISRPVQNPLTQGPNFQMQTPSFFADTSPQRDEAFNGDIGEAPQGYIIDSFSVSGTARFVNTGDVQAAEQNTIQVFANNRMVFSRIDETSADWTNVGSGNGVVQPNVRALNIGVTAPLPIRVLSRTCTGHILNFSTVLRRTAQGLAAWQQQVFDEIARQESGKAAGNSGAQDYESKLAQYNEAIDKLSAVDLNDIIRGRSPGTNEATVRDELKRQCIEEIAREFDTNNTDDTVSRLDAIGSVLVGNVIYRRLEVKTAGTPSATYAEFVDMPDPVASRYVADNLSIARQKGRYVQFLEQAFDWGQLSYILYPYFWAAVPRWIEMLDREDESDPLFTQFLRAGSARVLLSVKPAYVLAREFKVLL